MAQDARIVLQHDQNGPLEFVALQLPDPTPHQVMVKMLATGLCQSQIFWMHQPRSVPMLFGHEGYGVVTDVGSAVLGIRSGDPVLVTWVPRQAANGRLPEVATVTLNDGVQARSPNVYTWADYCVADELYVRPIPGGPHDPLMSIIGCAVITGAGSVISAAHTRKGESVAVFGVGGVGLSAVAAAKVIQAERIVAVDLDPRKLALAQRFGATDTVNSRQENPIDAILKMKPLRCGCHPGVDVAIDCVAIPQVTQQVMASLRPGRLGIERGGRAVLVGIPKQALSIDPLDMLMKEKSLLGALGGSCDQEQIDTFIDWYRDGRLDLGALVTDRYHFEDIPVGASALENGQIEGRAIALIHETDDLPRGSVSKA
jgi:Zn-dependent alcohol dehydrogenase